MISLVWDLSLLPNHFSHSLLDGSQQRLFTVILNSTLPQTTLAFVEASDAVILADGGANRFFDAVTNAPSWRFQIENLRCFRNGRFLAIGDLDSIRPDVSQKKVILFASRFHVFLQILELLKSINVEVTYSADQDTTDLQKALALLSGLISNHTRKKPIENETHQLSDKVDQVTFLSCFDRTSFLRWSFWELSAAESTMSSQI